MSFGCAVKETSSTIYLFRIFTFQTRQDLLLGIFIAQAIPWSLKGEQLLILFAAVKLGDEVRPSMYLSPLAGPWSPPTLIPLLLVLQLALRPFG